MAPSTARRGAENWAKGLLHVGRCSMAPPQGGLPSSVASQHATLGAKAPAPGPATMCSSSICCTL
eukprot:11156184-Lingulodinium_polyedra.AAC.1